MDKTSANRSLLSNPQILYAYMSGSFPNIDEIKRLTYNELHLQNPKLPDYAIKKGRDMSFFNKDELSKLIYKAFEQLCEYFLYFRGGELYVHNKHFHTWQDFITSVSPLPVISYFLFQEYFEKECIYNKKEPGDLLEGYIGKTSYPSIYSEHLNQLIKEEGLNERHLHINGSVETDSVWLKALRCPLLFYGELKSGYNSDIVKEQYLQIGYHFTPRVVYNLLRFCRELRTIMTEMMFKSDKTDYKPIRENIIANTIGSCSTVYDDLSSGCSYNHPITDYQPELTGRNPRVLESLFYIKAYQFMKFKSVPVFSKMFHIYILVLNQLNTLLVQQRNCYGFDQFQKVTMNDCRELSEKSYRQRFIQFEGMYRDDINSLEARFAPKNTREANCKRLKPLISEFNKYSDNKNRKTEDIKNNKNTLKLICHFIKEKDSKDQLYEKSEFILGRHRKLRIKNRVVLNSILTLSKTRPILQKYLKGFDAASNELHTPPEVYAPLFRYLRFRGIKNFTYHAGEDFIHLLSGIRAVYEAMKFLQLKSGNRIGHGTALGIDPDLWYRRSLQPTVIEKGEWLDNLVFTWSLLSERDTEFSYLLSKFEAKIEKFFTEIYGKHYPIYKVIDAWKLRSIDPLIAFNDRVFLHPFYAHEKEFIEDRKKTHPEAWEIFEKYHTGEVISKSRENMYLEKNDLFTEHPEMLQLLQNIVLQKLNDREIAIETLPTSNVRISYYYKFEEHHISRWLGYKNCPEDYQSPTLLVGTDDPGIFATNLRNEYAHIFLILTNHCGLSNDKAYQELKKLNQNGKMYGF